MALLGLPTHPTKCMTYLSVDRTLTVSVVTGLHFAMRSSCIAEFYDVHMHDRQIWSICGEPMRVYAIYRVKRWQKEKSFSNFSSTGIGRHIYARQSMFVSMCYTHSLKGDLSLILQTAVTSLFQRTVD